MVYLRIEFQLQVRNLLFTFAFLHTLKIFKSCSLLTFNFSVCIYVYEFKFIFSDKGCHATSKNYKTLMKIITIIKGKEALNLDKSEVGGYMRGSEEREERNDTFILLSQKIKKNLKSKWKETSY